jgi:hypothetical protein
MMYFCSCSLQNEMQATRLVPEVHLKTISELKVTLASALKEAWCKLVK